MSKGYELPPHEDAKRCFDLRCRSKRGEHISIRDMKFINQMFEKYPAWYHRTERDVFEATKPFGAK